MTTSDRGVPEPSGPWERFAVLVDPLEGEWRAWIHDAGAPPPEAPPAVRRFARRHARALADSLPAGDPKSPHWARIPWARSVPLCRAVLERWWSAGLPARGLALRVSLDATPGSARATGALLDWWLSGLLDDSDWCRWSSARALRRLAGTRHEPRALQAAWEALEREPPTEARRVLSTIVHDDWRRRRRRD